MRPQFGLRRGSSSTGRTVAAFDQGESVQANKSPNRLRLSTTAGLTALALSAALLPMTAAQAATTAAAGVQIKLAHSSKCLNVAGGSKADNAKIIQYGCSGAATATNEQFTLVPKGNDTYWIRGVGSGKCLNVSGGSTANGAAIIQYTCTTSPNSLWLVDEVLEKPTIRFVSANSGKCLNLPGGSTANSVALIQYSCTGQQTSLNEQFYLPPTASGTAVHRAFTSKQPISVVQGTPPTGAVVAPVYYSWISAGNQLTILTDPNPDPYNTDPNPPEPVIAQTSGFGYTGRAQTTVLQNGRVQVVSHDAAAGDVVLADEVTAGTGDYTTVFDIGGAMAAQPAVGQLAPDGRLATFAVIGGALWYATQSVNNPQTPYGAWRSLGGSGLTGTPAIAQTRDGAQIFVLNTAGQLLTAQLAGNTLSDWTNLGGTGLSGAPSVVIRPGYTYEIFVRSGDGTIVTKKQNIDGTYPAAWTPIGGAAVAGSPSAVMDPWRGRIAVAVRGTDNLIYYSFESGQNTAQYSDWILVSDPTNHPETVAASDPTAFPYDVPSGPSFGITFQSTDNVDLPVLITFASGKSAATAKSAKTANPQPELHKLAPPKKTLHLKN